MISKKAPAKAASKGKIASLVSYLLDQKGKNDRVAGVAVTNCQNADPRWAIHEMQAVQERNQRAKGDRTYHLVVSFRSGEDPSPAVLAEIEEEFCRSLGFGEHQRISVVHRDTDNLHLHVAINKVHPEKLTLHEPFNDYYTRAQLCRKLEARYTLEVDGNRRERDVPAQEKAAAMEALAGVESLTGYVQRALREATAAARSWQEVHEAFAKVGVMLKERGNGLVAESNGTTAKASSCFRELSKAALEKRFGVFQAHGEEHRKVTPEKGYQSRPMQNGSSQLYAQYQAAREKAKAVRGVQAGVALADHRRRIGEAKTAYKVQRTIIGLTRRGTLNKVMLQLHRANLKTKLNASFQTYKEERAAIYRQSKLLAWNDWLMREAAAGSQPAQVVLQSRRKQPSSPLPALRTQPSRSASPPNARPNYHHPDITKAPVGARGNYRGPNVRPAPLPVRPEYDRRPSRAGRLLQRAVALLQSSLGRTGRRGPAGTLSSVRDLSGLDVVHDGPGTEVLLRPHEPDRLGSEVAIDARTSVRRSGSGADGTRGEDRPGSGEGSRKSSEVAVTTKPAAEPYATRNGTLRAVVHTVKRTLEKAKGWTRE